MVKFNLYNGSIKLLLALCMGSSVAFANSNDGDSPKEKRKSTVVVNDNKNEIEQDTTIKSSSFVSMDTTDAKNESILSGTGLGLHELKLSGVVRVLSIYRNMKDYYRDDQITSAKNFSFVDYPLANVGSNNNGGFPNLELNLATHPLSKFQFNVGYSFATSFSGNVADTDTSTRTVRTRNNLRFGGKWRKGPVKVEAEAGGLLWRRMSRFTMGQPEYRDNYFDRVPWDWYKNSFLRYEEYYSLTTNIGQEQSGRSPMLGVYSKMDIIPFGMNIQALYGRTNRSVSIANSLVGFFSETYGVRAEKLIFRKSFQGKTALNYYKKNAQVYKLGDITDDIDMYTWDINMKAHKINFVGEVGTSFINNPLNDNTQGYGAVMKTEFDRQVTRYPFSIEGYYIDYNMVSLDGSIMNTNTTVRDAGFTNEYIYDNMLLMGFAQQVGQITNNRAGFNIKAEGNVKKLKFQIGLAASQELDNKHDTITFQHRVNSFSRSRFRPWFQAGGPYKRIKSFWLTTFETVTVYDKVYQNVVVNDTTGQIISADSIQFDPNYKKGFNTLEVFLKYKAQFLQRDLVILNFNNFNSIQTGFTPIPKFGVSNSTFLTTFYEDLTLAWKAGKRYSIVLNGGYEVVKGSIRTQLSPETGKPIDQRGWALGAGIDWDFASYANLHIRHKFMGHEDKNFLRDKFNGQETYLELKVFF